MSRKTVTSLASTAIMHAIVCTDLRNEYKQRLEEIAKLPKQYRKNRSHEGVLDATRPWEPRQWGHTYDPGVMGDST